VPVLIVDELKRIAAEPVVKAWVWRQLIKFLSC